MSERLCFLCERPMGDRDYFLLNDYGEKIGPVCEYCHEDAIDEERSTEPASTSR